VSQNEFTYADAVKTARDAQQKFEYFFLGVVLATASLSLQTIPSVNCPWLLFSSWIAWIASMISGFIRIERMVSFYAIEAQAMPYSLQRKNFQDAIDRGMTIVKLEEKPWTDEELKKHLGDLDSLVSHAKDLKEKRNSVASSAYLVCMITYLIGVVLFVLHAILSHYGAPA
jgi:hypothetical protein